MATNAPTAPARDDAADEQDNGAAPRGNQVLTTITHGGHVLDDAAEPQRVRELARTQESFTTAEEAVGEVTFTTPFGYLFRDLEDDPAAHLPAEDPAAVVAALKRLGAAMVEDNPPPPAGDSIIPGVYTYWGQFIDHDLTANTDRVATASDITRPDLSPSPPADVVRDLQNLRQPTLNLDSVYGDGPTLDPARPTRAGSFYDGVKLKVGTCATESNPGRPPIGGVRIPPDADLERDLPREGKKAQIADARNDENLIVAQFHLAFLRFHNAVVDWVKDHHADCRDDPAKLFRRARRLVRFHYQWLTANDYLKTVALPGTADKLLLGGPKFYEPRGGEPYMPLEFSVAAYRFGHSMVRAAYDFNRNFGKRLPGQGEGPPLIPVAPFDLLFLFTGEGFTRGPGGTVTANPFGGDTDVLPFNWIIEWDRMVSKVDPDPTHFARKIDTRIAPPLDDIVNQGNGVSDPDIRALLKRLAARNLLRGYQLSIPTGQAVAAAMGVALLSESELRQGNGDGLNRALDEGGFLARTPLWFYVLKEAEVRANGNTLGEVGSRIVCETMIGSLHHDPRSYLNWRGGWDPSQGVRLANGDPVVTIADLFRFAGIPA
jgi:hypothetical protein